MKDATTKPARVTVPLSDELDAELKDISDRTDIPLAGLLRQGAVRIVKEFRESGSVVAQELPDRSAAA